MKLFLFVVVERVVDKVDMCGGMGGFSFWGFELRDVNV